jgi:hypothetical protein
VSVTLDLPDDLVSALQAEADRQGLSLSDYAARLLAGARPGAGPVLTGADLVAYWQAEGLIGNRPDVTDAATHARSLRDRASRRDWQ